MPAAVSNQLGTVRRSRGLTAAELAKRTGVSRQTIYAIEGGSYVPNTAVSLRLASVLEVSVESLFRLSCPPAAQAPKQTVDLLSASSASAGQAMRIGEVGTGRVAVPVQPVPYFLPEADGVLARLGRGRKAELVRFPETPSLNRVVIAGCDPAIGLLAAHLTRESGVELIAAPASSRLALRWLKLRKVHVAGTHLHDLRSGDFNLPLLRAEFAGEDLAIVTFAHWQAGFITAPQNPHRIRTVEDLARPGVRFANREPGSGSRALLDRLLKSVGLPSDRVVGYGRLAPGHLAAAYAVFRGEADCCIAPLSAAQAFGLAFVPLQLERFDLAMRRESLQLPDVRALLDALQHASLRRKLEAQAGYETHHTGASLA